MYLGREKFGLRDLSTQYRIPPKGFKIPLPANTGLAKIHKWRQVARTPTPSPIAIESINQLRREIESFDSIAKMTEDGQVYELATKFRETTTNTTTRITALTIKKDSLRRKEWLEEFKVLPKIPAKDVSFCVGMDVVLRPFKWLQVVDTWVLWTRLLHHHRVRLSGGRRADPGAYRQEIDTWT